MPTEALWYRWTLLLPYFFLAWQSLGFFSWDCNWRRASLTLGLGGAWLVLLTMLSAPWTHSLGLSLALGAGAAAGLGLAFSRLSNSAPGSWQLELSPAHLLLLAWLGFTAFMVARIAWRFDFHDQMRTQCHPAVVEAILRGNFPPHLQVFPEIPLKYHFAGDLLASIFAYCFGLPGFRAIDWLQILGWLSAGLCLYSACRELGMNRFLSLIGLHWALLAGGWLYLLKPLLGISPAAAVGDYNWPDSYVVFQRYLNPGVISYFFQTPYCIGLPVFFTYLALLQKWLKQRGLLPLTICAVLLGAFSLIHVTLFLGSLGCTMAVLAGQSVFEKIPWRRSLLECAAVSGAAVALALFLGGFFSRSPDYSSGLLAFHWPPGYLRYALDAGKYQPTAYQSFLWYLCTLGSLVIWGIPVVSLAAFGLKKNYRPISLFLLCFALGSFAFPQFFYYRLSWDIIKWFTAFQLSLILLTLLTASELKSGKTLVFAALLTASVLDTLPSYRLLYGLSIAGPQDYQGKQRKWFYAKIPPHSPLYDFLRNSFRDRPWSELVLATRATSDAISIYTGQAMASADFNTIAFGVRDDLTKKRNDAINAINKNFNPPAMRNAGIRWLVYSCTEFDREFPQASQEALQKSVFSGEMLEIKVPAEAGCWKIYFRP